LVVHSALPAALGAAAGAVLHAAGVAHVAHGDAEPLAAAEAAAGDARAVALLGPFRSADVAEAVEVTAPAGLPLLAPVATWAGVTRDDEPGCDDAARHRGTVLRLVGRDTVVAARVAEHVHTSALRALVVAGAHEYGRQLDAQLRLAGLRRAVDLHDAGVVILCGLAGSPEAGRAARTAPLPVVAFDGIQGAELGQEHRSVLLALPFAPVPGMDDRAVLAGEDRAARAAALVVAALAGGARARAELLAAVRVLGRFDVHGDPAGPPVWLWRVRPGWRLEPERPI
jgi:hypothetical protein